MQKVITVRASQSDLDRKLNELTKMGWKVVSVTKGSELGGVGFSYKWTIVLDVPENQSATSVERIMNNTKNDLRSKSLASTIVLVVGIIAVFVVISLIVYSVIVR